MGILWLFPSVRVATFRKRGGGNRKHEASLECCGNCLAPVVRSPQGTAHHTSLGLGPFARERWRHLQPCFSRRGGHTCHSLLVLPLVYERGTFQVTGIIERLTPLYIELRSQPTTCLCDASHRKGEGLGKHKLRQAPFCIPGNSKGNCLGIS